jgi:Fe-S oxidoreductase
MKNTIKNVVPVGHRYIRGNILEKSNIIGVEENKAAWAKDLDLPRQAEYTFFAGCGYQFMKYAEGTTRAARTMQKAGIGIDKSISLNIGISKALGKVGIDLATITAKVAAAGKEDLYTRILISAVSVLRKLGIDIGYLHQDEPCCGSPLYYAGFLDDYIENARKNCALLESLGIKKVIGLIPACTASLQNVYPQYVEGFDLKVYHFSEVVAQELKKKRLKPRYKKKLVVTYHDPCQLSRYLDIVDEPREILNNIDGLELREPDVEQRGKWSTCCGGGGLEAASPELCERLGKRRVEELLKTGAEVIVSHCPACIMQLRTSVKKLSADVSVMDLVEILDQALE